MRRKTFVPRVEFLRCNLEGVSIIIILFVFGCFGLLFLFIIFIMDVPAIVTMFAFPKCLVKKAKLFTFFKLNRLLVATFIDVGTIAVLLTVVLVQRIPFG